MKVFISWSGQRSKSLAELLRAWIPAVIQAAKPYFSPDDIVKGSRWGAEVAAELEASRIGLLCLTPDNLDAPWIMFESGALSKSLGKSKVCPILFGVDPSDLKGPLVQFQAARFQRDEIERLVRMINGELGELSLASDVLADVFTMWWPKLEAAVRAELAKPSSEPKAQERTDRDLLQEILELARSHAKAPVKVHGRVSSRAVYELVSIWEELVPAALEVGGPSLSLVRAMRRPLGHIARYGGSEELSDRFHKTAARLFKPVALERGDEALVFDPKPLDAQG